ncbi:unnamed protein product [Lampetra fluviatilis]
MGSVASGRALCGGQPGARAQPQQEQQQEQQQSRSRNGLFHTAHTSTSRALKKGHCTKRRLFYFRGSLFDAHVESVLVHHFHRSLFVASRKLNFLV